jgi:telomere length regulation protein
MKIDNSVPAIVYLLSRLSGQGVFPPTPPVTRSQISFFKATMPSIRRQLEGPDRKTYSTLWSDLTANMPPRMLQSLLRSMFATLQDSIGNDLVLQVKVTAQILQGILGAPFPDHHGLWECVSGLLVDGEWHEILTQGIVCWISGASFAEDVNDQGTL